MVRAPLPILSAMMLAAVPFVLMAPVSMGDSGGTPGADDLTERFVLRMPGVEREMTFYYGPFTIPPGQDNNRITIDVPVHGGFLTSVQANLYDAVTGTTPSNQDMHIHHAHWFRTSEDPDDEYYTLNLAWVFGTGEERTKGDINARSLADPDGPSYGIFIEAGQPQALIYMLHNKNPVAQNMYVALDVKFVYGTTAKIAAASDCGPFPLDHQESCRAGEDFHHVHGTLWGNTYDVPRNFEDPTSVHIRGPEDTSSLLYVVSTDGMAIGSAGHLHPNGREVVIANAGPEGSGCEADLDGDGFPGVTLLRSGKIDMVPAAWPHSEEAQMGVTKPGWRAPVREGDRLMQFGVYENGEYASYEAMSFTGLYVDRQQPPGDFDTALCASDPDAAVAGLRATLIDVGSPSLAETIETVVNHDYHDHSHGHCGIPGEPACHRPLGIVPSSVPGNEIHMAGFYYVPGDQSLSPPMGAPLQVQKGDTVRVVNEDVAIGVRHTLTTCEWPCNGPYVANYPHPDGHVDTGKLGNLDYIDGGLTGPDTVPYFEFDTSELEPGMHSYYCRIHPWMRGWFEVVE